MLKETKSATMNIFQKKIFSKNGVYKSRIKLCFHNMSVHYQGGQSRDTHVVISHVLFIFLLDSRYVSQLFSCFLVAFRNVT